MRYLKHAPITLLTLLLASPVFVLGGAFFLPEDNDVFLKVITHQLPDYAFNTFVLLTCVLFVTGSFGTYSAWCVSRYRFNFRRVIDVLLMLPLAVPSYINAMVYGRLLDVAGPVHGWLGWAPNIYSLGGLVFVLSLSLLPYVYMAMRIAFSVDMSRTIEAAQMLGVQERQLFRRVALPAARPAFIAGLSLVAMETLAEFGASSLYGVNTFTTGIYHVWYQQFSPIAAAQLAMVLVLIVLLILWLEKQLRHNAQYHHNGVGKNHNEANLIDDKAPILGNIVCFIPCLFGFIVPVLQLIYWASFVSQPILFGPTLAALNTSLTVAFYVAIAALSIALIYAYLERHYERNYFSRLAVRLATMGYAIPGTVIAVALFISMFIFMKWVHYALGMQEEMPPVLIGSIAAMVAACVIRFLAVAFNMVQPALMSIPKHSDEAGVLLGASPMKVVSKLHMPLMKPALVMGAMVVMVDTLRELPASLMLRPFDTSTLAIRTYELAVDGRLVAASQPALYIVLISTIAMVVLHSVNYYASQKGSS